MRCPVALLLFTVMAVAPFGCGKPSTPSVSYEVRGGGGFTKGITQDGSFIVSDNKLELKERRFNSSGYGQAAVRKWRKTPRSAGALKHHVIQVGLQTQLRDLAAPMVQSKEGGPRPSRAIRSNVLDQLAGAAVRSCTLRPQAPLTSAEARTVIWTFSCFVAATA